MGSEQLRLGKGFLRIARRALSGVFVEEQDKGRKAALVPANSPSRQYELNFTQALLPCAINQA